MNYEYYIDQQGDELTIRSSDPNIAWLKSESFKQRKDGSWTAPLSLATFYNVLNTLRSGDYPVEVSPYLAEWGETITARSILPGLHTPEYDRLKPYQKQGVSFLLAAKRAILGFAPGLGKTATALSAARFEGLDCILLVSPVSLLWNWTEEAAIWWPELDVRIWQGETSGEFEAWLRDPTGPKMVAISYGRMDRWYIEFEHKFPSELLIADETILIKNRKTVRFKALKRLSAEHDWVWLLTGSPTSRFLDDMWSQLNIVQPRRFRSYWRFAEQVCVVQDNVWGGKDIVANKPGAVNWIVKGLPDVFFSCSQDVLGDLPDWIFETVHLQMGSKQSKFYQTLMDKMLMDLSTEGESDPETVIVGNVLVKLLRCLQALSNPALIAGADGLTGPDLEVKFSAVEELLEYRERPAIVWTNFIGSAKMLKGRLEDRGYLVRTLIGEVSAPDRQEAVNLFQDNKLDVLIAHPQVGKFGFTLTAARTCIYLERSFNSDDFYQSLHRVRRIGTTQSPTVLFLLAQTQEGKRTLDHKIHAILDYRVGVSRQLTVGDLLDLGGYR